MQVIDAQLHEFGPSLEWKTADEAMRHGIFTELLFAWMDAAGVNAALLFPTEAPAWGEAVIRAYPERLRGVFKIPEGDAPDVEEQVLRIRSIPGAVGTRLSFGKLPTDRAGVGPAKFRAGAFEPFFAACERHGLPLFCSASGYPEFIGEVARAHPGLQLIIDHMGIAQPPLNPRESPAWNSLPGLLALAASPNIAVKLSGAPVLSGEAYPFADNWPHLRRIIDTFGVERIMWGSDIARFAGRVGWNNLYPAAHGAYPGRHTYAESLFCMLHTGRLTSGEKEMIMGGTIRRMFGWTS